MVRLADSDRLVQFSDKPSNRPSWITLHMAVIGELSGNAGFKNTFDHG